MSYHFAWRPYVSVAQKRRQAEGNASAVGSESHIPRWSIRLDGHGWELMILGEPNTVDDRGVGVS
jgi:hypothetical protein